MEGRAGLPEAREFPEHPASWYCFCPSRDLGDRPLSKTLMGRRLVAYRDRSGRAAVLDAHCAHLGADLGRGQVVDDTIQCPFHHWRFSGDGRCRSVPNDGCVPDSARLRAYPVTERHGHLFFFLGPEPLFPLPFFPDSDPDEFVAGKSFRFSVDSPWFMVVGNGFDGQHFQAVHDRRLTTEPQVDCPDPMTRRMQFEAEVIGTTVFDRLLRQFAGGKVRVSITSWGGPYVLVEGAFANAHSRLLVACRPVDESNTVADVIVFARKRSVPLVNRVSLRIRRRFTRAFVQYDMDKLRGIRYQPGGLTAQDRHLADFFRWAADLPRSAYEDPA